MRVGQRVHHDHINDKLIVETKHEWQSHIDEVKRIREQGIEGPAWMSDSKHVGRIPLDLLTIWIKEAGLKWSDTEEVKALVKTKMLSGEFDKLRVWQGTY